MLDRLRRLSILARTPDDPCELRVDERGVKALDGVLIDLHAARRSTEGLEAAWLGKGKTFIVRLAGVLELLGFTGGPRSRPGAIGAEQVEAAAALWRSYFWPHARAVFDSAELSDHKRRVRRVACWLRETRPIRCRAKKSAGARSARPRQPTKPSTYCSGCTISATFSPTKRMAARPALQPLAG